LIRFFRGRSQSRSSARRVVDRLTRRIFASSFARAASVIVSYGPGIDTAANQLFVPFSSSPT
jgi:hypothetical protein